MDVEGQYKRAHKRERICPIAGKGSLSKSERERRARDIVVKSGADTEERFNRVVKGAASPTFREQATRWLQHMRIRKRKPVAVSTILTWDGCLTKWINPYIGEVPLSQVNNAVLKDLVKTMVEGGLSAKTITNYCQVVKMVVASAVNSEGEQLFPRKWNHDFVDMPLIETAKQNTPSFSASVMSGLGEWKYPRERTLFILCGAAGLRIGEALGLEIDKHFTSDFLTLTVAQKVRHCKVEQRLKTASAARQIDLHSSVAALLRQYVGERKRGFLFQTRNGKPLSSSCILRRHLHPALKEAEFVNPHTHR